MSFKKGGKQRTVRLQGIAVVPRMDAAGYVKHVEAVVGAALDVGHHAVADGKNLGTGKRAAGYLVRDLQRDVIDRRVGFAGNQRAAAELGVIAGDRPRAPPRYRDWRR